MQGFLTHKARLKATWGKLVWMKLYAVVAGVAVLVVLLYTDHVEADFAHASLLIDLLKVVLVTTYMTLQTLCMGESRAIILTMSFLAACAVQSSQ